MYEELRCSARHERSTSEQRLVYVMQGCILSPFMFLLGIDSLMRKMTEEKRGKQYMCYKNFAVSDIHVPISLSSHTQHMQKNTDKLKGNGNKLGCKINQKN